jgi:DNA-binding IclR family transcriptional regulator
MRKMKNSTNSIQVIERLARLLDVIGAHKDSASLKTLSAETGLHPSTAFRILASLAEQGFVERTSRGNYQLGIKLMQLGTLVNFSLDIRKVALPLMESLRNHLDETVNLTMREDDEVVYIERALAKRMIRVDQVIGSRAPLHVTAVGKLMLGDLGEAACRSYAKRSKLPAYTVNTHTKIAALLNDCKLAAQRGYSLDNEEAELGVGCIGTLVRDASGTVVAGLSVSAPIERRRDEWIELVVKTGQQLSKQLGYRPS